MYTVSYENVTTPEISNRTNSISQSRVETLPLTEKVTSPATTYVTQPEAHLPQFFLFILFAVVAALSSYCIAKLARKLCRCDDVIINTPCSTRRNEINNSNGGSLVAGEITTGLFSMVTLATISPLHSPQFYRSARMKNGISGVLGKGSFLNKTAVKNISLKRVQEVEPG